MNLDYSAYEGWQTTGKVKSVLFRGELAIDKNKRLVPKGFGRFIKRKKVSGKYLKIP
jgi:dihydropyrimidinase